MAGISTSINLQDNFTGILYQVFDAVNLGISAMEELHQSMSATVEMSSIEAARESLNAATAAAMELDEAMQRAGRSRNPATGSLPEPRGWQWQPDSMDVFTGSGIGRFEQEVQSANNMLNTLSETQGRIMAAAAQTDLLPADALADVGSIQNRLQAIQQRIQVIESNPLNMGTDTANAELEQLRGQLDRAVQEQQALNRAVDSMDIEAANAAYLRLSGTIGNTERYIRDNVDEQGRFNREIEAGTEEAGTLMQTIKGAVAAYATIQALSSALDMSDQMASTAARLDLMNDGLQTTEDLQNMVYLSAERSRGSYQATADAVSKLGLMAGDAFGSSEEIISFMEQVNKNFTIAGTEAAGVDAAMLQLTQAMASGVLRGEEYNSILEQAPTIIQAIADYMDVPKGQLKDMAAEGEITADIVKEALFAAADETNEKFESMPATFAQVWTSFRNTAMMAFQPVLGQLSEFANSTTFQGLANSAAKALSVVAGILLHIFDLFADVGEFAEENWSWLSPIIYGVATALTVYYGAQVAAIAISALSKGAHFAMAAAQMVHAAATGTLTVSTAAEIAAQNGLNASMYACPIVWIIMLIIALIAIIYAVCAAIAKATGIAESGFGVICGAVNVAINFFKNLGMMAADVGLGIWGAMGAVAYNIKAAFHNVICSIQSWFYDLLSTTLTVVTGICEALNKLPFVEIDYSGITAAADEFAAKSAAAAGSKLEYRSIKEAFNEGFTTFDAFKDGWISDAFASGAAWGDGIADSVSSALDGFFDGIPNPDDYAGQDERDEWLKKIRDNTDDISDDVAVTQEDLKYLRDIAEQETINRFTTAEIIIEQTNHNTVSGKMDLDGVVDSLTDAVNEAVDIIAEGVHE